MNETELINKLLEILQSSTTYELDNDCNELAVPDLHSGATNIVSYLKSENLLKNVKAN